MHLFGTMIPLWVSNVAIVVILGFGAYQTIFTGVNKFKFKTFGKLDSQIGSIADMYFLLLILIFFLRLRFLYMFYYYALNVMLFLICVSIIPAFLLAKSKHNYRSILGDAENYEEQMLKIKKRRNIGLLSLIILAPILRGVIARYLLGGKLFAILFFLSIVPTMVIKIVYRRNQVLLGGNGAKKSKQTSSEPNNNTEQVNTDSKA